jgi:hypothetical protein
MESAIKVVRAIQIAMLLSVVVYVLVGEGDWLGHAAQ